MENDDFAKQVEERLAQLPEDIQNAIMASDFDQKMQAIGRAHNLHIDQAQQLGNETLLVMLGVSPMSGFTDDIIQEVRVSKEEADKIIADINTQILAPIRESMKKTYEESASTPTSVPQNPPAMNTKSVVMPSAVGAPRPAVPQMTSSTIPSTIASFTPPATIPKIMQGSTPTPTAMPMPKPPMPAPDMHPAEIMLTEKTLQVPAPVKPASDAANPPPDAPPKPEAYKADPYREPIE